MTKIITRHRREPGQPIASDLWRSPGHCFEALHAEHRFDLDCAAHAANALCRVWLGPGGVVEDALTVRWGAYGRRGYLNPGYSTTVIKAFMAHAAQQCVGPDALDVLVCLVPCDPSAQWWEHTRGAVEIREIPHRLRFVRDDGTTGVTAMFPSAVVVYRPQPGIVRAQPRRVVWTWREQARSHG